MDIVMDHSNIFFSLIAQVSLTKKKTEKSLYYNNQLP